MKEGFRQSMAWLHTWTGLLVGWVLYFIFVTGTLGYVNAEIDHWMQPEKPLATASRPAAQLLPMALDHLQAKAPDAQAWFINFPGGRGGGDFTAAWRAHPQGEETFGEFTRETLDQRTGRATDGQVRETGGGHVLYRMHYELHYIPYDWAIRIVGVCAMFMLAAIVSGVITHKKIFADFFTFRPAKGQRSWLDGHNLLSVAGLPFHLMITYSGLVLFLFQYMPAGPDLLYGPENRDRFFQEAYDFERDREGPLAPAAPMAAVGPMLSAAEKLWGPGQVARLTIEHPGRADAHVEIRRKAGASLAGRGEQLGFDGVTGAPDAKDETAAKPALLTNDVLSALHEGLYAGPLIRILYLLAGASGAAMIGTGLVLWSVKRKAKLAKSAAAPHFGIEVVDRLNLGAIVGLPIAVAGYFWANRLLPVGLEHRADWEVHAMFLTWAAMFIYPIWRPLDRAWIELCGLAAAAFALIPVLNLLTTDRHLGVSIPAGDGVLAGFDLSMLGLGAAFGWLAWRLVLRASRPAPVRKDRRAAALQEPAE